MLLIALPSGSGTGKTCMLDLVRGVQVVKLRSYTDAMLTSCSVIQT